jgi:hypothetical protein
MRHANHFRFLIDAFNHGNEIWARNPFVYSTLRKIVSAPRGHPVVAAVFMLRVYDE